MVGGVMSLQTESDLKPDKTRFFVVDLHLF